MTATSAQETTDDGGDQEQSRPVADGLERESAVSVQGRSPSGGQDVDPELQERIAEAIQPVLADFERQVVHLVEQRLASAQEDGTSGARLTAPPDSASDRVDEQRASAPPPPPAAERSMSEESDESEPSPDSGADDSRKSDEDEGLLPTLGQLLHGVERQSGNWTQNLLANGLNALFSDSVRAAIQDQLNQSIRALTQDVFSGITSDAESRTELEDRTEQLMGGMLDDLLDDIFHGSVRREVEYHGDEAVQALRQLDFDVAVHHVQEALQALVLGIVRALGGHWGDVLKLLLKIVIEYFQDTVTSSVSEGFSSAAQIVSSTMEIGEKGEELQEKFEEKTNELGEKLREASDTLRQRISESSEELKTRLQDGRDGGKNSRKLGMPPRGRQLGVAPTGKPPSGPGPSNRR